jgi:hypothetical protein
MATTDCIIYQSATNNNVAVQNLSNLRLSGFCTIAGLLNTDPNRPGRLYGTFAYSSGSYSFKLYTDVGRTQLVASASATTSGTATITAQNGSGITGTINIIPGTAVNDNLIEAVCLLSQDSDLPLDNLQVTSDYDPTYGFADFHRQSFQWVVNGVSSRFESELWNASLVSDRSINGGTGGLDLSRVLNWQEPDLVQASAEYALHLIARKQAVTPDGVFAHRAKCSYERAVALLQESLVKMDTNLTRVPRRSRNLCTFKTSRA